MIDLCSACGNVLIHRNGALVCITAGCRYWQPTAEQARAQLESEGVDVDAAVDRALRACAEKAAEHGTPMHPSLKRRMT